MFRKHTLLIVFLAGIAANPNLTAAALPNPNLSNLEVINLRNPFESQLPKQNQLEIQTDRSKLSEQAIIQGPEDTLPAILEEGMDFDPSQFRISGIVWNSPRPQAIVNNRVVDIGDEVNGARIISIQKEGIAIALNDQIFTITP